MTRHFLPLTLLVRMLIVPAVIASFFSAATAQDFDDGPDHTAEAVAAFNSGQDAHEKGELDEALKLYEKALTLFPEFPEAEYQRASILISKGRTDEAEKALRHAVELRSDWSLAQASLGALLLERNNLTEAEEHLTRALNLDASNFPALSALTELRIRTKAEPRALQELLGRIRVLTHKANPQASMWTARAALERELGDRRSAKESLTRAIELEPNDKAAIRDRAILALEEKDLVGAKAGVAKLEELDPDSEQTKTLRSRILAAEGNGTEALALIDSIHAPSKATAELRSKIVADSAISVGDLEKQLAETPGDPAVLGRLCTLARRDDPERALEYCRKASEAEPNNISHAVGFASALIQAKHPDDAVTILKRLTLIAPDNVTVRANLGTALFQLKRYREAIAEFSWMTNKQPEMAGPYYFLAVAHDHLGDPVNAMANYRAFLKLANAEANKLEIEKVNLRLPALEKQLKGKKNR